MRDKRQKFVELAEARVNRTIRDFRLIGNLSNKSAYEYYDEDIKDIFRALQQELDMAKKKFGGSGRSSDDSFRLKSSRGNT